MTCNRTIIQELFPAYLDGTLGADERRGVEDHIAGCTDCAAELDLLRMLAAEPVPDPGEAYWSSVADSVYGEINGRRQQKGTFRLVDLLRSASFPQLGWASVAIAMVVVLIWFVMRPLPHRISTISAKRHTAPAVDIIGEATNNADVGPADLDRLSSWAHQELLSLQQGIADLPANGNSTISGEMNVDVEDALVSLSEDELETLIDTLDQNVGDNNEEA